MNRTTVGQARLSAGVRGVRQVIPFLIASVAALATYVAVQQERSVSFACVLSVSTVALLLVSASLSTLAFGAGFVDEWCES